jgi:hypothetical protein
MGYWFLVALACWILSGPIFFALVILAIGLKRVRERFKRPPGKVH